MPVRFQLVINAAGPDRLSPFWGAPRPAGFASWHDYFLDLGIPEEELALGADRISDPQGHGPAIWFQMSPDAKVVKNRLHLDIHASGRRADPFEVRKERVDAEASRLAGLGAAIVAALDAGGVEHYSVAVEDPEGNEFDIN